MAPSLSVTALLLAFTVLQGCEAMSAGFIQFMTDTYGATTANSIARPDLCAGSNCFGSFGGGNNSVPQLTAKIPVLIIPDGSSGNPYSTSTPIPWAGNYTGVRDAFFNQGYTESEVYAITWWDGLQLVNEKLKCDFTGQIRVAILAIAAYTQQPKVNVIGYCLGNLLARKAILGGQCVDQSLNIGSAMTSYVNHYVSVGSPNYGSTFCGSILFSSKPVCNSNNGYGLYYMVGSNCSMFRVKCMSDFLKDVNNNSNPPGYEGTTVNTIYATNDQLLGDAPCTAPSGVCPAPGSPKHTGSVCAQAGANALAPSGSDPHYQTLVGATSIGLQVSIVMS